MGIVEYRERLSTPLRQASLCLLIKDDEILLGMKKRGFAEGKWNGFGGKPNNNEKILDTAIREVVEEVGITPSSLVQVALLDFYFPHHPDWNQQVTVYSTTQWEGDPTETEEMKPKWFAKSKIPYNEMWVDDIYWLPLVLDGKKIRASFLFGEGDKLLDQESKVVESFDE